MTRGKRAKKTDNTKKYLTIAIIVVIIIAVIAAILSRKPKEERKENITNSVNIVKNEVVENTTNEVEEQVNSYNGKYVMDDSSSINITKEKVDIEIYRLATIKGTIESDENGILEIKGTAPNNTTITLTFDTKTKVLKVKDSKFEYLENGTEFQFK